MTRAQAASPAVAALPVAECTPKCGSTRPRPPSRSIVPSKRAISVSSLLRVSAAAAIWFRATACSTRSIQATLFRFSFRTRHPPMPISVLHPGHRKLSPRTGVFADWLAALFERLQNEGRL